MPRAVIPGYPHHVTQRGNRRQTTFFCRDDFSLYLQLIAAAVRTAEADILAYCLMPNHVHFVVVPGREDSLAALFSEAHRRYTLRINRRNDWRGHLWQERFHSFVMDEFHLLAAVRYIEQNPVRAGLCTQPTAWPWSSVHAHLAAIDDAVVSVKPMLDRVSNWSEYLAGGEHPNTISTIRRHGKTGRPAGSDQFIRRVSEIAGRNLAPRPAGRKAGNR